MTTYTLDATGAATANTIQGEVIDLAQARLQRFNYISPAAGLFYTTGLTVSYTDLAGVVHPWVNGIDYVPCLRLVGATAPEADNLVYAGIAPANSALLGTLTLNYQAFGGDWRVNHLAIDRFLLGTYYNPNVSLVELVPEAPLMLTGQSQAWALDTFDNIDQAMAELGSISLIARIKYTGLRPVAPVTGGVGSPGPKGDTGLQGLPGAQGPAGADGAPGAGALESSLTQYAYLEGGQLDAVTETIGELQRVTTYSYNADLSVQQSVAVYDGQTTTVTYNYANGNLVNTTIVKV